MMFLVCLITKMTIDTNIAFANNLPNGKLRLRFNFPGEMGNGNYEALELDLFPPASQTTHQGKFFKPKILKLVFVASPLSTQY